MASPSQIAEPRGRPVSGMPSTNAPSAATGRTYKAYGQEYQYAERLSNPPPEFVVGSSDPVSAGAAQTDGAADNNIGPDSPNDRGSSSKELPPFRETEWKPSPKKPWYEKVPKIWWIIGIITPIGILGVTLAVLGAMGHLSGNHQASTTSSESTGLSPNTTPCTGVACPTSTSSALPIPTEISKECADSSSFIQEPDWVGPSRVYSSTFAWAESPEACCNLCFHTPGCASWLYDISTQFTPCVPLVLTTTMGTTDNKCPMGYCDFTKITGHKINTTAGIGPCSRKILRG